MGALWRRLAPFALRPLAAVRAKATACSTTWVRTTTVCSRRPFLISLTWYCCPPRTHGLAVPGITSCACIAEREARASGVGRLVLLTTRTADWCASSPPNTCMRWCRSSISLQGLVYPFCRFEARGFRRAGLAHESVLVPRERRAQINAARNSQLFVKEVGAEGAGARHAGAAGRDRLAGAVR